MNISDGIRIARLIAHQCDFARWRPQDYFPHGWGYYACQSYYLETVITHSADQSLQLDTHSRDGNSLIYYWPTKDPALGSVGDGWAYRHPIIMDATTHSIKTGIWARTDTGSNGLYGAHYCANAYPQTGYTQNNSGSNVWEYMETAPIYFQGSKYHFFSMRKAVSSIAFTCYLAEARILVDEMTLPIDWKLQDVSKIELYDSLSKGVGRQRYERFLNQRFKLNVPSVSSSQLAILRDWEREGSLLSLRFSVDSLPAPAFTVFLSGRTSGVAKPRGVDPSASRGSLIVEVA